VFDTSRIPQLLEMRYSPRSMGKLFNSRSYEDDEDSSGQLDMFSWYDDEDSDNQAPEDDPDEY
jgi:hypothetical protein